MTALPPLLAIAEGRKVRARKAPVWRPKEVELHITVAKLLRDHCLEDWRWTHIPTGEHRDIRTAAKLKAMGSRAGFPDFVLVSPYGSVRFLELKRTGGKLSEVQDDFRLWCVAYGVPHVVARTIGDVLAACESWGCLRVSVAPRVQALPSQQTELA